MKLSHTLTLALSVSLAACTGGDDDDDTTSNPRDGGPPVVRDAGPERDGGRPRDGGPDRDGGTERDGGPERDGGTRDGGPPDIRIPGLTSPVDVKFDEFGVLHLRCQTDADCFAAEGYFHASHRFPQMDIRRRFAAGRLAEVFGPLALDNDRSLRHFISTRTGGSVAQQIWDNSNAESRAMVTAYTAGINAWIDDLRNDRNGAVLPPEYLAYEDAVADWTEIDSIACILALIEQLTNQSDDEIRAGELAATLPADLFVDAFGLAPGSPSVIQPPIATLTQPFASANASLVPAMASVGARLDHARDALRAAKLVPHDEILGDGRGSNNWVVGNARTAGDYALLANDPHLGMSQPSVWYLVSLDSKSNGGSIHIAGSSFAGLPGVILGQNEDIAWGATTTFFDMADVYVETLNTAGDAVIFNGQEVPITTVQHTFGVLGGQPITEPFEYVEHHGPVVSKDTTMGIAITIKWTGQEADTDLNVLHGLFVATNITEARTAIENVTTIGQNWVVADRAGGIGWFPYNRVPLRPWNSPQMPSWMPIPGDGDAEWQGFVPYSELPQALNPPQGYVATANNDMTGHLADGDPTNDGQDAIQHYVATGYRGERIQERIEAGGSTHTRESMQSIQADVHSLLAERTIPMILAAANDPSAQLDAMTGQRVRTALTGWDFDCPTGLDGIRPDSPKLNDAKTAASSIGCAAFHALFPRIVRGAFADELTAAGTTRLPRDDAAIKLLSAPGGLLRGSSYWDDVATTGMVETSTAVIANAMNQAGTWLNANLGNDPDDWRWGRVHTVTLTYDLLSALTNRYNNGPFCNDGGLYTVDVANPGGRYSDNYAHGSGPSMRLACEAASAAMSCTIELPGGQSSFPTSPHYDDLLRRWLVNDPIPLRFTTGDIDAAAVETLTIMAP